MKIWFSFWCFSFQKQVIANCIVLLILSSALPALSRTLGKFESKFLSSSRPAPCVVIHRDNGHFDVSFEIVISCVFAPKKDWNLYRLNRKLISAKSPLRVSECVTRWLSGFFFVELIRELLICRNNQVWLDWRVRSPGLAGWFSCSDSLQLLVWSVDCFLFGEQVYCVCEKSFVWASWESHHASTSKIQTQTENVSMW